MHDLIDSHFHLVALQKKGIDLKDLLDDLFHQGFAGGIDIGIAADDIGKRLRLIKDYPLIKSAAGIGPWGAEGQEPIHLIVQRFYDLMQNYQVDCIGEIGLDFHWNYGTPARQRSLCIAQMELATSYQIPVIIHTRTADAATIDLLQTVALPHSGILHCFSSTWDLAQIVLDKGLYISFAGPITYKSNVQLRQVLAKVPLERLLLETDSPFLSPEPYRGKINTPLRMVEIYNEAARIKNLSVTELAQQIKTNFSTLFCMNDNS
ncbi:MAG: TatD family hydrolase [Sphaerochaetaceae bacterium]|jgi:TatD DNase family protein|nr:TatD family hydrolase [Sphaerochaetaceae bacterium]MDD3366206.1 TatD family hydrolase [Sphaerochaetaceae bacterium]MDY0371776.1 TatD family hydrolase [Sphaerochaetaceae bacterium]